MSHQVHRGGSFAPPFSDDQLAAYEQLAAGGSSPAHDALRTTLACVKRWWDLPTSTGSGLPDRTGRALEIPLDPAIRADLEPAIPWEHELRGLESVLDACQAEAVAANAARLAAWREAVTRHYVTERLGGDALVGRVRVAHQLLEQLERANDAAVADALRLGVSLLFPGDALEQARQKIAACQDEINAALRPGGEPPIARPALEDTRLRDALAHCLWCVKELNLDREPLTLDVLG